MDQIRSSVLKEDVLDPTPVEIVLEDPYLLAMILGYSDVQVNMQLCHVSEFFCGMTRFIACSLGSCRVPIKKTVHQVIRDNNIKLLEWLFPYDLKRYSIRKSYVIEATRQHNLHIFKYLYRRGGFSDQQHPSTKTIFMEATAKANDIPIAQWLVKHGSRIGKTFNIAAEFNNLLYIKHVEQARRRAGKSFYKHIATVIDAALRTGHTNISDWVLNEFRYSREIFTDTGYLDHTEQVMNIRNSNIDGAMSMATNNAPEFDSHYVIKFEVFRKSGKHAPKKYLYVELNSEDFAYVYKNLTRDGVVDWIKVLIVNTGTLLKYTDTYLYDPMNNKHLGNFFYCGLRRKNLIAAIKKKMNS